MTTTTPAARPLRRDAEANRQRIMAAATEIFASRGLSVTMDQIADAAGVGVGTVYRRFPDKALLIEALFDERLEAIGALADQAAAMDDPTAGLRYFLEESMGREARDRALAEVVRSGFETSEVLDRTRTSLRPRLDRLLQRAQDTGTVRPDLTSADLVVMRLMLGEIAYRSADVAPELWRRYFELLYDACLARPDQVALPGSSLPDGLLRIVVGHGPEPAS